MEQWFKCKKCGQIFTEEIMTFDKCPFCGHNSLSKVILKSRDISPTYTLIQRREWIPPYKRKKET